MSSSIYHPKRYSQSRPFARRLLNIYRSEVGISLPTITAFQHIADEITNECNQEIMKLPFSLRPDNMLFLTREVSLFCHFATYYIHGQNIFYFNRYLVEEFRKSDVEQVLLSSLRFPFDSFFVSFFPQEDLQIGASKCPIDGAYVSTLNPGCIDLVLTSKKSAYESALDNFILNQEPYYYWTFDLNALGPATTVAHALEEYIEKEQPFKAPDAPSDQLPKGVVTDQGAVRLIDGRGKAGTIDAREMIDGYGAFREAIKLVFNGLCFLTAYRDHVSTRYPDNAPKRLVEKSKRGSKQAEQKLAKKGFTKIHFCQIQERREDRIATGKDVRVHWRRGHWRNQAHGEGRQKHKIVWIRPTLVRADKGQPDGGHIYQVNGEKE